MRLVPILVRVLVILLAFAGVAGQVAYLDAVWWHALGLTRTLQSPPRPTIVIQVAQALVSVLCSALAVVMVLSERHRQTAARGLSLSFAAWGYVMAYSGVTLLFRPQVPGLQREIFEAHLLVVEFLGLGGLLRYTAVFPRELTEEELLPSEALPPVLIPVQRAAVAMRGPWAPLATGTAVLVLITVLTLTTGGEMRDAGLSPLMDVVRFAAAGVAVLNLRVAWGWATEGDRDALTWLLVSFAAFAGAVALLVGANVLTAVTGFPEPTVAWRPLLLDVGLVGFMTALALSVLPRADRDPSEVLRKVTAATAVTTLGLFFAAALEALFGGGLLGPVVLRNGVGTAVAFAIVLATHRQLAGWVTRILPL